MPRAVTEETSHHLPPAVEQAFHPSPPRSPTPQGYDHDVIKVTLPSSEDAKPRPTSAAKVVVEGEFVVPMSTKDSALHLLRADFADPLEEEASPQTWEQPPMPQEPAISGLPNRILSGIANSPSSSNKYGAAPTSHISAGVGLARPISTKYNRPVSPPEVYFVGRRPSASLPQANAWRVRPHSHLGGGYRCA